MGAHCARKTIQGVEDWDFDPLTSREGRGAEWSSIT